MLTPEKIDHLVKKVSTKHTVSRNGLYPPQKKIVDYISKQIGSFAKDNSLSDITKIKEMTNLLEGFIRYLNNTSTILKLDIQRILTYIYYPEEEEVTLANKDNLMIGNKGLTTRLWHDAYSMTNREQIIKCLEQCKNFIYNQLNNREYIKTDNSAMPEQMQKKYEEMLTTKRPTP